MDDYLAEVDDHLFCVSRADRNCLRRDLKAHIKELTLDQGEAFEGMYRIDYDQLVESIGSPKDVSDMYIASVRKVPSVGMRLFLAIGLVLSVYLIGMGIRVLGVDTHIDGPKPFAYSFRPYIYFMAGITGIAFSFLSQIRLRRSLAIVPFYCFLLLAFSNPISVSMANLLARGFDVRIGNIIFERYYYLFLVQLILIIVLGLYITLKHYRVHDRASVIYI